MEPDNERLYDLVVAAIGDQYDLDGEIGRGGMSVVYRARDRRLNRPVAIKVLPPELAFDPAIRARFTREAQTAAHLSHAHIVPIYDVGERDGIAYFVMTIVTGGSLATLIEREPRQQVDEVRRLLCECADALAYAHLRGVIHRDVKPDNILLDGDSGRVLVTDFGIARAVESGTRLTVTGMAIGTPTYMSPEQALGEREIDGRSDIYSLGVLGYQMLTGRVPFSAGNSMALLLKHVNERPQPIVELRPDAPAALRATIERAMMKAPEDRWPTAAAMREALMSERSQGPAWRTDQRDQVRYTSPRPGSVRSAPPLPRAESRPVSPRRGTPVAIDRTPSPAESPSRVHGEIELEPEHLAALTPAQRADLRLWQGRVNLADRIRAMRRYTWLTIGATIAAIAGIALGADEGLPPLFFGPIVPIFMWMKVRKRGLSLRASGLRLRRVLLLPRAKWVLPAPPPPPTEHQLEKLAPREVLDSPHGAAIRSAAADRSAIMGIAASLPKADRSLLSDLTPTVNALVERVATVAQALHRLDHGFDPRLVSELDARIAQATRDSASPEAARQLTLLQRQRATLEELVERRAALSRQMESAGLALGNLRLDLVKLRSSGLQSALTDVSTATQEARALSREIGILLESAAEAGKV
ncbi:MAG TPA: serine/threonine-protein kinase [Gemmatimonadaceae bacterium]|nr:serine/threonine-protein kinase [Gemmatimonadaceae bacterium]